MSMDDPIFKMSSSTADLLFGSGDPGMGDLHKLMWQITQAQANADSTVAETTMWKAMKHPSCEPPMPDLDWSAPMPVWEQKSIEVLLAEIAEESDV